jgi:hypothetical protein
MFFGSAEVDGVASRLIERSWISPNKVFGDVRTARHVLSAALSAGRSSRVLKGV